MAVPPGDLWHQFAAPLRAFVARRAPGGVDVDDVVQDVFVRIQEQLPNLRDAERIDAWIFQIARNVIADSFRVRTRREALAERTVRQVPAPPEGDGRAAETALASCLASMIARLGEPYREAIERTELGGMTQIEAARRAGISISGMKSRVQRGREHLARTIRELCRIETDVRGGVIQCDPRGASGCGDRLRPSPGSSDSMDMTNPNAPKHELTTTTSNDDPEATAGCCGGPAPAGASACCALDADVKATGGSGCGCGAGAPSPSKKGCC